MLVTVSKDVDRCDNCLYYYYTPEGGTCELLKQAAPETHGYVNPQGKVSIHPRCPILNKQWTPQFKDEEKMKLTDRELGEVIKQRAEDLDYILNKQPPGEPVSLQSYFRQFKQRLKNMRKACDEADSICDQIAEVYSDILEEDEGKD